MAKRTAKTGVKAIQERAFASRIVLREMGQEGVKTALWHLGKTGHLRLLLGEAGYPKEMPESLARELRSFVHDWINKRTQLDLRIHDQAKILAEKQGINESKAYLLVAGKRGKTIARRLSEKAVLEQLLWVMSRHKALEKRGRKPNPLEAGKHVRELARHYLSMQPKAVGFQRLAQAVANIPIVESPLAIAEAYYNLPTAEETLAMGRILGFHKLMPTWGIGGKGEKVPVWGCSMLCDVMNAALTQAGWENYQIRTRNAFDTPHSLVLARTPEKNRKLWLLADPFINGHTFIGPLKFEKFRGSPVVSQVGLVLGEHIKEMEAKGKWKKGKSSRDSSRNFLEYQSE